MRKLLVACLIITAVRLQAQDAAHQVSEDARAIERVAEVSGRDLPVEVLRRIATEDLELLRGKQPDGTYSYARHEREEAGRIEETYTIRTEGKDRTAKLRLKGDFVYRLVIQAPSRRLLVAKNRRVRLERVDLEYQPTGGRPVFDSQTFDEWLEPGARKTIDLPAIARNLNVVLYARLDEDSGPANLELTLLKARVSDNRDSPYADAVQYIKSILRALDKGDGATVRSLASSLRDAAGGSPRAVTGDLTARGHSTSEVSSREPVLTNELHRELQDIEDSLTGTAEERRIGLDRLHQLIRRTRPPSR
ncbi:MAG TPA: hypothetical protein VNM92_16305 [Thermoanaerobaculia bacterium]|nr:hypothetical protein [Thermoanaerobaculia bacterium]